MTEKTTNVEEEEAEQVEILVVVFLTPCASYR